MDTCVTGMLHFINTHTKAPLPTVLRKSILIKTTHRNWENSTCDPIICPLFTDKDECLVYSTQEFKFICAWKNFTRTVSVMEPNLTETQLIEQDASFCFNNCTKGFEIVLTVDTSSSVSDVDAQLETIIFLMSTLWELSATKNAQSGLPTHFWTKFALVTYARDVIVHFDLNNNFTSLSEYISATTIAFAGDLFKDDTATAPALNVSVEVFKDSIHYLDTNFTHAQVLMTGMCVDSYACVCDMNVCILCWKCDVQNWLCCKQNINKK